MFLWCPWMSRIAQLRLAIFVFFYISVGVRRELESLCRLNAICCRYVIIGFECVVTR
jgi:hypothetical protein